LISAFGPPPAYTDPEEPVAMLSMWLVLSSSARSSIFPITEVIFTLLPITRDVFLVILFLLSTEQLVPPP